MSTIITYDGFNPFGTRTPEVAVEEILENTNGYVSHVERYTIKGTRPRPSCNATFEAYRNDMEYIMSSFKNQFKTFQIIENGNVIASETNAIVRSVSFPEDNFDSFYQYEIVIDSFNSYQGILEPAETYESSQQDSSITNIQHTISCRGIGPFAYTNAKIFLDSRIASFVPPKLLGRSAPVNPILLSKVYTSNKLTGEYSLTRTYSYDDDQTNNSLPRALITYTTELSEDSEKTIITISGDIQAGIDDANGMSTARALFSITDWQLLAQREWENWGGAFSLGETITFSVNENPLTGQVSFSMSWDTASREGPYIRESITINQNIESPTCFSYRGTIRQDHGCVGERFAAVEALFKATNFQSRALSFWGVYGTGETLSNEPRSLTITRNEFAGTITFEMTLCHDSLYACGCAEKMVYSLDFTPPIEQYAAQPVLRGQGRYIIQDLGFKNRRKFSIRGSARRAKCCTVEQAIIALKSRLNFISFQYFPVSDKILEVAQIDKSESGDILNYNYGWSGAV